MRIRVSVTKKPNSGWIFICTVRTIYGAVLFGMYNVNAMHRSKATKQFKIQCTHAFKSISMFPKTPHTNKLFNDITIFFWFWYLVNAFCWRLCGGIRREYYMNKNAYAIMYIRYRRFNDLKLKNPEVKTLLAVGGWTHSSDGFKEMVVTKELRNAFLVKSIAYLKKWGFDGLDLDWEYPAVRGGSPPADKQNFVLLCQVNVNMLHIFRFKLNSLPEKVSLKTIFLPIHWANKRPLPVVPGQNFRPLL